MYITVGDYIDEELNKKFEKETGIKVVYELMIPMK